MNRVLIALSLMVCSGICSPVAAAEGDLDTSFGTDGISRSPFFTYSSAERGGSIALQDDGKIVVAGHSFATGSTHLNDVAVGRVRADGSVDEDFGRQGGFSSDLGGDDEVRFVRVRSDGSIIVAGDNEFGVFLVGLDRFGQPLSNFGTDGVVQRFVNNNVKPELRGIAIDDQDRIVVIASEDELATRPPQAISVMRFRADGSADNGFGIKKLKVPGMDSEDLSVGNTVVVADGANGDIVIGGGLWLSDDRSGNPNEILGLVIRLNSDGSLDEGFDDDGFMTFHAYDNGDPDRSTLVEHILMEADGSLVVMGGGQPTAVGLGPDTTPDRVFVARLDSGGSLDTSFAGDGVANPTDESDEPLRLPLTLERSGLIDVDNDSIDMYTGSVIWRLNRQTAARQLVIADDLSDNGFNPSGEVADVMSMTNDIIAVDDGYLISGRAKIVSNDFGVIDLAVAKVGTNGKRVTAFGVDGVAAVPIPIASQDGVTALTKDSDGRYLVGGGGEQNNEPRAALARFNADGTRDNSFGRRGQRFWNWQPYDDRGQPEELQKRTIDLTQDSTVGDIFVTPDGKVLVGGTYKRTSDAWPDRGTGLAQFTAAGDPDTSVLQGQGYRGAKTHSTRDKQPGNGRDWPEFYNGPDTDDGVQNIGYSQHVRAISLVQVDGQPRILVSGEYQGFEYHNRDDDAGKNAEEYRNLYVARFHMDGSLDTSFGNKSPKDGVWRFMTPIDERNPLFTDPGGRVWGENYVHEGADILLDHHVLPNGEILAVGQMGNDPNFETTAVLLKLDQHGELVESFGASETPGRILIQAEDGGINFFTKMAVDQSGRIVVAGIRRLSSYGNDVEDIHNSRQPFVARFTADGQLDSSFGDNGIQLVDLPLALNHVGGLALQDDGRILIAGNSGTFTVVRPPPFRKSTEVEADPWLVRIPANGGSPDLQRIYDDHDLDRCMGLEISDDGRRAVLACEGDNQVAVMAVQITDAPDPNRAPVIAQGSAVTVTMDRNGSPQAFDLSLSASDADGDDLSWAIGEVPERGDADVSGSGSSAQVFYDPPANALGSDVFTVIVSDGLRTDSIEVTVDIEDPEEPELDVFRGASEIFSGGSDQVGGSVDGETLIATYTITNNGTTDLVFTSSQRLAIVLATNCDALVTQQLPERLAAGVSAMVQVAVTPSGPGAWTCNFRLLSNDSDESTFTWSLRGTASDGPEPDLAVYRDGVPVLPGSSDRLGETDAQEEKLIQYTLTNVGSAELSVTGDVVLSDFSGCAGRVVEQPKTTLAPSSGTRIAIGITPDGSDTWSAVVSVVTNDPNPSVYAWTVTSPGSSEVDNSLPVIEEGSAVAVEIDQNNSPRAFALTLHGVDADDDRLEWAVATDPTHGWAQVQSDNDTAIVEYGPDTDYLGTDEFTITLTDGIEMVSTVVTVSVVEPTDLGDPIRQVRIQVDRTGTVSVEITPVQGRRDDSGSAPLFFELFNLQSYRFQFVSGNVN